MRKIELDVTEWLPNRYHNVTIVLPAGGVDIWIKCVGGNDPHSEKRTPDGCVDERC